MSTEFITQDIWQQLTKATRSSRQHCCVAVAYFGKGAGKLLPLAKGSRLVVDASERSVAAGQTCPADLSKLVKRGVKVYSVPNLHAKVFVLGRAAYIGSANVSNRSASQLVEAVIRTTDASAMRAARQFVLDHCLHELTPTVLRELAKHYHPPLIPGGKRGKKLAKQTSTQPTMPRLLLTQLYLEDWSQSEQAIYDAGLPVAQKRRKHPLKYNLNAISVIGKCNYERGDVIIQVTKEGRGKEFVSPPGNVLHTKSGRDENSKSTIVYIECPNRPRKSIKVLAQILGCTLKQLRFDGVVRPAAFARDLLNTWAK